MNVVSECLGKPAVNITATHLARLPQLIQHGVRGASCITQFFVGHCAERVAGVIVASNVGIAIPTQICHVGLTVPATVDLRILYPLCWLATIWAYHSWFIQSRALIIIRIVWQITANSNAIAKIAPMRAKAAMTANVVGSMVISVATTAATSTTAATTGRTTRRAAGRTTR